MHISRHNLSSVALELKNRKVELQTLQNEGLVSKQTETEGHLPCAIQGMLPLLIFQGFIIFIPVCLEINISW